MASYTYRHWNDDERKNDYIPYYDNKEPEHVPVYKYLKEMYDEDKANLYIYDSEEEYRYMYGEYYFDRYSEYLYEYYGAYYELSSFPDVFEDDEEPLEVNEYDADREAESDIENIEKYVEKDKSADIEEESIIECSKFIYT